MDMGSVPFADAGLLDAFYGGGHGHNDYGLVSQQLTSPVVLDGGAGGLLDAGAASTEEEAPKRKGDHRRDDKAAMALKNHSEAERRRRERINAHLATLRTMVPCSDKVPTRWRGSLHRRAGLLVRRPLPASGAPSRAGEGDDATWQRSKIGHRLTAVETGPKPSRRKAQHYLALGPILSLLSDSPDRAQHETEAQLGTMHADGQGRAAGGGDNPREEAQGDRGADPRPLRRPGRRGRRRRRAGPGRASIYDRRRRPREGDAELRRRRRRVRGRQAGTAAAAAQRRRLRGHHARRPRPLHLPHHVVVVVVRQRQRRRRGRRRRRVGAPGAPVRPRQGQLRARVRAEGVASQQAAEGLHVRVLELLFLNLDRSDDSFREDEDVRASKVILHEPNHIRRVLTLPLASKQH